MNTIAMHQATSKASNNGLRRGIRTPVCLSALSPVYVLHEPPSP